MFGGALRIAAMVLSFLAIQAMVPIVIPQCNRLRTRCWERNRCPDCAGGRHRSETYPDLGHPITRAP